MLRSILSQLDYYWQINSWHDQGVPFKDHLYVPEVHPATGLHFCEREDEGHVFKVNIIIPHAHIIHYSMGMVRKRFGWSKNWVISNKQWEFLRNIII